MLGSWKLELHLCCNLIFSRLKEYKSSIQVLNELHKCLHPLIQSIYELFKTRFKDYERLSSDYLFKNCLSYLGWSFLQCVTLPISGLPRTSSNHALTRICSFSRNVKQLSLFGDSFLCEKSFPSISVRSSTLANSKKIRVTFQFLKHLQIPRK